MTVNKSIFFLIICISIEISHFVPIQMESNHLDKKKDDIVVFRKKLDRDHFYLKDSEKVPDRVWAPDKFTFIDRTRDPCFPVCDTDQNKLKVELITAPLEDFRKEQTGENQSDEVIRDVSIQAVKSFLKIIMNLITKLNPRELTDFLQILWRFVQMCKTCDNKINRSEFVNLMLWIKHDLIKGLDYDEELFRQWKCYKMLQNRDQQFFIDGSRRKLIEGGFDRDVDEESRWPHPRFPDGKFSNYPGDSRKKSDVDIESLWPYQRYPDGTRNGNKYPLGIWNKLNEGGYGRKYPDSVSSTSPPNYVPGSRNITKDGGNIMKLGISTLTTGTPPMTPPVSKNPESAMQTQPSINPLTTTRFIINTIQPKVTLPISDISPFLSTTSTESYSSITTSTEETTVPVTTTQSTPTELEVIDYPQSRIPVSIFIRPETTTGSSGIDVKSKLWYVSRDLHDYTDPKYRDKAPDYWSRKINEHDFLIKRDEYWD